MGTHRCLAGTVRSDRMPEHDLSMQLLLGCTHINSRQSSHMAGERSVCVGAWMQTCASTKVHAVAQGAHLCPVSVDDLDCVSLVHAHCLALPARNQREISLWLALNHGGCSC